MPVPTNVVLGRLGHVLLISGVDGRVLVGGAGFGLTLLGGVILTSQPAAKTASKSTP